MIPEQVIGLVSILAQGVVVWVLFRLRRSFGAYTAALQHTAKTNEALNQSNLRILEALQKLPNSQQGAA